MHDTPEAIAMTDKAAQDLMLSELLKVCTPAPWLCEIAGGNWVDSAYVRADKWGVIARIGISPSLSHWDVPQKASAKLIALAPTIAAQLIKERALNAMLLEALKNLANIMIAFEDDGSKHAFQAAKAIIAKAEGKQNGV